MHAIDPLFDWFLSATLRGSLLILAVLLVQIALGRKMPAGWRQALWLPVLFVLGSPVLPRSPLSIENGWAAPGSAAVYLAAEHISSESAAPAVPMESAPVRRPIPWATVAGWIWISGAIVALFTGLVSCWAALAGFRHRSRPISAELHGEIQNAARACGLRRVPRVLLSAEVPGPAMAGLFRPLLLLPAAFEETFDGEERRLILLHEFNHVRRGDLLANGFVVCLQALHWCNPLVWLAFRRFRADRELACDSAVLASCPGDDRSRYGHALLKVERAAHPVAWRLGFLGLVGLFGRGGLLSSRITAIAGHRRANPVWNLAGPGLLLAIGVTGATRAQTDPAAAGGETIQIETKFFEVLADQSITFTTEAVTHDPKKGVSVFSIDSDVIEQIAAIPGTDLLSAPSLLTLSGNKATIEIGTPKPDATGKPIFTGTRLEVLPTLADGKIRLALQAHRTEQIKDGGGTKLSEQDLKADFTIAPGDMVLVTSLNPEADQASAPIKRLLLTVQTRLGNDGDLARARLEKIVIPSIELRSASLTDALAFLREKARELDPEKKGVNFVHIPAVDAPEPQLTVSFKQIPLTEALRYFAELSNLELEFGDSAVVMRPPSGVPDAEAQPSGKASAKSAVVAARIVLPQVEFAGAPLPSVLQFLQNRSLELDPEKKGLNLILNAPGEPLADEIKITLTLRNVPLSEALKYVAALSRLKLRYDEDAVVLSRE
ncbi:MAG: hypothetical protein JNK37_22690 [Verrucomicrobiales bacterium]|nr:hypothetical protein [Verrucomicrobiales bacterium]